MNILLNNKTNHAVEHFITNPSHAVCIFGSPGSGKEYLATLMTHELLQEHKGNVMIVRPNDNGIITIDNAREITQFFKLKSGYTPNIISRAVLIIDAHTMNEQTQNALLKTLEELPNDAVIIMSATTKQSLLPTIVSRIQAIDLHPVTFKNALDFFKPTDVAVFKKNWLMSEGRIGLLQALNNNENHPLVNAIKIAKKLISADVYNRLLLIDSLQKQNNMLILDGLAVVSRSGLHNASDKNIARWHKLHKAVFTSIESQKYKPNNKLSLTNLMLTL